MYLIGRLRVAVVLVLWQPLVNCSNNEIFVPSPLESTEEDSSPERLPRRGVTFRDTVETFPVSGRMDRLRRLLYEEAEEQRKQHTKVMRKTYRDQLREQENEREKTSQHKRKLPVSHKILLFGLSSNV